MGQTRESERAKLNDQWEKIIRTPRIAPSDFWPTFGAARVPVIIEDSVPQWRLGAGWTIEYLRNSVGHRGAGLDRSYSEKSASPAIPINEILDGIEGTRIIAGHEDPYLRNVDVHSDLPELVPDVSPRLPYALPNWLACRFLKRDVPDGLVEFFVGGAGSSFPNLHFDTHGSHAFITQLQGTKHVVAAPPSATTDLARAFGEPKKFRLGCERHVYENIELYSATLKAGETLYVPAGWWHTTYMTELSMSVSTNCVNAVSWPDYIDAITCYTRGVKRPVKRGLLIALGNLLRICDAAGIKGIYRKYV